MTNKQKILTGVIATITIAILGAAIYYFSHVNVAVLNPQGQIGAEERNLFVFTIILSLFVVVPVFILLAVIAWKYRDTNTKKKDYKPDWDGDRTLETIWWGIPIVIISILSIITWQTSHTLDPFRALDSNVKPLKVQVVSLQWKWLFIYPDQGVASVNFLEIPEKTPINFEITSDAPMNSFWVPSLGSQVYAMSGMSTQLHLIADHTGDYKGSSANISGKGFADMAFTVRAASDKQFDDWVAQASKGEPLTQSTYDALAKPDTIAKPVQYKLESTDLYNSIIEKYMQPMHQSTMDGTMGGTE